MSHDAVPVVVVQCPVLLPFSVADNVEEASIFLPFRIGRVWAVFERIVKAAEVGNATLKSEIVGHKCLNVCVVGNHVVEFFLVNLDSDVQSLSLLVHEECLQSARARKPVDTTYEKNRDVAVSSTQDPGDNNRCCVKLRDIRVAPSYLLTALTSKPSKHCRNTLHRSRSTKWHIRRHISSAMSLILSFRVHQTSSNTLPSFPIDSLLRIHVSSAEFRACPIWSLVALLNDLRSISVKLRPSGHNTINSIMNRNSLSQRDNYQIACNDTVECKLTL
jgi:hypothetical protein